MPRDPFETRPDDAEKIDVDAVPLLPPGEDEDHEHDRAANLGYNVFGSEYLDRPDPPADILGGSSAGATTRSDAVGPAGETVIGGGGGDFGEYDVAPSTEPENQPLIRKHTKERPKVVGDDRVCRKCGYALLGLPFDGRCPECGTPVAASRDSDLLRYASREWLDKLVIGCRMIWIGMLGLPVAVLLAFGTDNSTLIGAVLFAGNAAIFGGACLLTMRDPSGRGDATSGRLRIAVRVLVAIGFASAVLEFASGLPGMSLRTATWLGGAALVLAIPTLVGYATIAAYVGRIGERVPDPFLVDRAGFVTWSFIAVLASAVFMFVGGVIIALVDRAGNGPGGGSMGLVAGGVFGCCFGVLLILFLIAIVIVYMRLLEHAAQAIAGQRVAGDLLIENPDAFKREGRLKTVRGVIVK